MMASPVAGLFALEAMIGTPFALQATSRKAQDKSALGDGEVEQLLLLIDTGKTGTITKREWMKFMEAEFDRLDENGSGELDARELAQSRLRAGPFANVSK